MAQSRAVVAERVERVDIILLMDFMILSSPRKALEARIWSCRRVVTDSTEQQFWTFMASGCLAKVTPVLLSYACKADLKSARKRVDPDWSPILQVGKNMVLRRAVGWL